jgi:hypothetical protein
VTKVRVDPVVAGFLLLALAVSLANALAIL